MSGPFHCSSVRAGVDNSQNQISTHGKTHAFLFAEKSLLRPGAPYPDHLDHEVEEV